jgi:hypothetical protein
MAKAAGYDILAAAGVTGRKKEERSDKYLVVDASVGAKMRGGGGLEIKLRKERKKRFCEKYKKHRLQSSCDESSMPQEVAAFLEEQGWEGETGLPIAPIFVKITKMRTQFLFANCAVEQTDINGIEITSGGKTVPISAEYRSFCVEGSTKAVYAAVDRLVAPMLEGDTYVQVLNRIGAVACAETGFAIQGADPATGIFGYPAFICGIAQGFIVSEAHIAAPISVGEPEHVSTDAATASLSTEAATASLGKKAVSNGDGKMTISNTEGNAEAEAGEDAAGTNIEGPPLGISGAAPPLAPA